MAGRSVDRCKFAAETGDVGPEAVGNTGAIISLPESGIKLPCALALDWVWVGGAMRVAGPSLKHEGVCRLPDSGRTCPRNKRVDSRAKLHRPKTRD
jgi:hypothetical protein